MTDDIVKQCSKCGTQKPLAEFSPRPGGGVRASCRACQNQYQREARAVNPEQYRERKRKTQRRYVAAHPGYQRERWRQLQHVVFGHYGRSCACCGAISGLSIDHANGDGWEHREQLFGKGHVGTGTRFYLWLIREGFPDGFQVLCMPCNRSKGDGPRCRLHNPEPHCSTCSCYSS